MNISPHMVRPQGETEALSVAKIFSNFYIVSHVYFLMQLKNRIHSVSFIVLMKLTVSEL